MVEDFSPKFSICDSYAGLYFVVPLEITTTGLFGRVQMCVRRRLHNACVYAAMATNRIPRDGVKNVPSRRLEG